MARGASRRDAHDLGIGSTGHTGAHAEMARLVAMLEDAGLVEVYVNDEGQEAYRLTAKGVRVGNMLAMVEGEDADTVLEALLREYG